MKKLFGLFLALTLLFSFCACGQNTTKSGGVALNTEQVQTQNKEQPENTNKPKQNVKLYKVSKVVDGDTIEIIYNGTNERVRLIGVDSPESVHPDKTKNSSLGVKASDFTKSRLTDKEVSLEFDVEQRDKYQRILAYVYLDGKMFNKTLVEEGYAKIYTYPPNVKYADDFLMLERKAREDMKGLWAYWNVDTKKAESSDTVYITKSGKKYHANDCSLLKGEKIEITKQEAIDKGYTPCKMCNK